MNKLIYAIMLLSAVCLTSCKTQTAELQLTPLQIQSMQTQTFKTSKRKAFNETIQALQDVGYTIESANYSTGLISAQSMIQDFDRNKSKLFKIIKVLSELNSNYHIRSSQLSRATAFIAAASGKKVKVRISLVNIKRSVLNGGTPDERSTQIVDPSAYTKLFNGITLGLSIG